MQVRPKLFNGGVWGSNLHNRPSHTEKHIRTVSQRHIDLTGAACFLCCERFLKYTQHSHLELGERLWRIPLISRCVSISKLLEIWLNSRSTNTSNSSLMATCGRSERTDWRGLASFFACQAAGAIEKLLYPFCIVLFQRLFGRFNQHGDTCKSLSQRVVDFPRDAVALINYRHFLQSL